MTSSQVSTSCVGSAHTKTIKIVLTHNLQAQSTRQKHIHRWFGPTLNVMPKGKQDYQLFSHFKNKFLRQPDPEIGPDPNRVRPHGTREVEAYTQVIISRVKYIVLFTSRASHVMFCKTKTTFL